MNNPTPKATTTAETVSPFPLSDKARELREALLKNQAAALAHEATTEGKPHPMSRTNPHD
jgi:hypothetical protein